MSLADLAIISACQDDEPGDRPSQDDGVAPFDATT